MGFISDIKDKINLFRSKQEAVAFANKVLTELKAIEKTLPAVEISKTMPDGTKITKSLAHVFHPGLKLTWKGMVVKGLHWFGHKPMYVRELDEAVFIYKDTVVTIKETLDNVSVVMSKRVRAGAPKEEACAT